MLTKLVTQDRTETTMLKGLGCLYPVLIYTRMRGGAEGISELGFACAASSLFMIVSPLGVLVCKLEGIGLLGRRHMLCLTTFTNRIDTISPRF